MEDSPLTPETLETFLLEWRPLPNEEYAAAYRYQEFMYCMKELVLLFQKRHRELVDVIQNEGLLSDEFLLEIPTDHVVNTDLLKDELPDVYDSLVFIQPSDAKRFIGLKNLYQLSIEAAGRARVAAVERVNLLDLKKVLPAPEAAKYVTNVPHENLAKVVRTAE